MDLLYADAGNRQSESSTHPDEAIFIRLHLVTRNKKTKMLIVDRVAARLKLYTSWHIW